MSEVVTPNKSLVEYTVVFKDDTRERLNGSFEFSGHEVAHEAVLGEIVSQHFDLDWANVQKVLYTVSELMNNNVKIVSHEGEASGDELVALVKSRPDTMARPQGGISNDYNSALQ